MAHCSRDFPPPSTVVPVFVPTAESKWVTRSSNPSLGQPTALQEPVASLDSAAGGVPIKHHTKANVVKGQESATTHKMKLTKKQMKIDAAAKAKENTCQKKKEVQKKKDEAHLKKEEKMKQKEEQQEQKEEQHKQKEDAKAIQKMKAQEVMDLKKELLAKSMRAVSHCWLALWQEWHLHWHNRWMIPR